MPRTRRRTCRAGGRWRTAWRWLACGKVEQRQQRCSKGSSFEGETQTHPPMSCQPFPLHERGGGGRRQGSAPREDLDVERDARCFEVDRAAVAFRERRLAREEDGDVVEVASVGDLDGEAFGRVGQLDSGLPVARGRVSLGSRLTGGLRAHETACRRGRGGQSRRSEAASCGTGGSAPGTSTANMSSLASGRGGLGDERGPASR